jgi:hypothetical protein
MRVFPPGCNGDGTTAPRGQEGRTGCRHHYPPTRNLAAEGCACPAWFDGGGWHILSVNPECGAHAINGEERSDGQAEGHAAPPTSG